MKSKSIRDIKYVFKKVLSNRKHSFSIKIFCLIFILVLFSEIGMAQSLGINTSGAIPDSSAMLDIISTNKGLLIPRVSLTSTTDTVTIRRPATSLQVYNTNASMTSGGIGFWYWNGTHWVGNISGTATNVTGIVLPANGGTGLANSNSSTLKLSGAFADTITTTAATNVTLPTSGTLYGTKAGSITSSQLITSMATPSTITSSEVGITIDGGGSVISTGQTGGFITIPYSGTITGWKIFSTNGAGGALNVSCVLDAWKTTYSSFPPTVSNTIFSGNKPTLTSTSKNQNTSMSVAVTAGDMIGFNVDSNTGGLLINCVLTITKN